MKQLATTLILACLLLCCTGCAGKRAGAPHEQHLTFAQECISTGEKYGSAGMSRQADYYYGIASANLGSLRLYLQEISSAIGINDVVPQSFEEVAAYSYASPYPWYFEGLVAQKRGEDAEPYFENTVMNSSFPDDGVDFRYLEEMNEADVNALYSTVLQLEQQVRTVYVSQWHAVERDAMSFSDEYWRGKVDTELGREDPDFALVDQYVAGALLADPFDGANFASAAVVALFADNHSQAIYWINEGLYVDADSQPLQQLAAVYEAALEE